MPLISLTPSQTHTHIKPQRRHPNTSPSEGEETDNKKTGHVKVQDPCGNKTNVLTAHATSCKDGSFYHS